MLLGNTVLDFLRQGILTLCSFEDSSKDLCGQLTVPSVEGGKFRSGAALHGLLLNSSEDLNATALNNILDSDGLLRLLVSVDLCAQTELV